MKNILLLFLFAGALANAQITTSDFQNVHNAANPNGQTCQVNISPTRQFNGTLYTCQAGVYAQAPGGGGGGSLTPSGVGVTGPQTSNKLTGPVSSVIGTDGSGNGAAVTGATIANAIGATPVQKANAADTATGPSANVSGPVGASGTGQPFRATNIPDYVSLVWPTNALSYGNQTTNSIASTITAFSTNPNVSFIPPNYATTEALPGVNVLPAGVVPDNNIWGSPCTTSGKSYMIDLRYGWYDAMCNPIGNNGQGVGLYLVGKNHNTSYWNSNIPFGGHAVPESWITTALGGGQNYFDGIIGHFYKTTYGMNMTLNKATMGQTNTANMTAHNTGLGDTYPLYVLAESWGGSNAAADEGTKVGDFGAIQGNSEYAGTVAGAPATGAASVTVTPTTGVGPFQGEGRDLVNLTSGVTSTTVSAVANSSVGPTVLTASGLTASTTIGVLGSPGILTFGTPTTFTPSFSVGAIGNLSTSTLVCVADGSIDYERIYPTAVNTGAGTVTITFVRPKSATAVFSTGGHCGQDYDLAADDQTAATFTGAKTFTSISGTLHYVYPIVSSTSTTLSIWTAVSGTWQIYQGSAGMSNWASSANGAASLYQAAYVSGVQSGGNISNTLALSANNITWGSGDSVTQPMYFGQHVTGPYFFTQAFAPHSLQANLMQLIGEGVMNANDNGLMVQNLTPANFYTPGGGVFSAPTAGVNVQGEWGSGLNMTQEPDTATIVQKCASCASGTMAILLATGNAGFDTQSYNKASGGWFFTTTNRANTFSMVGKIFTSPGVFVATPVAATTAFNAGSNQNFTLTPAANISPTLSAFSAGEELHLKITPSAANVVVAFPSNLKGCGPISTVSGSVNQVSAIATDTSNAYCTGPTMDDSGNASIPGYFKGLGAVGTGASPTCAVNTSFAGAGATCSLAPTGATSTDLSGRLTLTTNNTTTASGGSLVTVTFANTHSVAPQTCTIQPQNTNAIGQSAMVYSTPPTTTNWTVSVAGSPLPVGTFTYQWGYSCF